MFDELQIGSPMTEKPFEEVTLSELRNLINIRDEWDQIRSGSERQHFR